jgi:hypothetical protein
MGDHQPSSEHPGSCALLVIRVMTQLMMKRRWFIYPLINKEFRVCHPLLARGNFVPVTLNHQKCARARMMWRALPRLLGFSLIEEEHPHVYTDQMVGARIMGRDGPGCPRYTDRPYPARAAQ